MDSHKHYQLLLKDAIDRHVTFFAEWRRSERDRSRYTVEWRHSELDRSRHTGDTHMVPAMYKLFKGAGDAYMDSCSIKGFNTFVLHSQECESLLENWSSVMDMTPSEIIQGKGWFIPIVREITKTHFVDSQYVPNTTMEHPVEGLRMPQVHAAGKQKWTCELWTGMTKLRHCIIIERLLNDIGTNYVTPDDMKEILQHIEVVRKLTPADMRFVNHSNTSASGKIVSTLQLDTFFNYAISLPDTKVKLTLFELFFIHRFVEDLKTQVLRMASLNGAKYGDIVYLMEIGKFRIDFVSSVSTDLYLSEEKDYNPIFKRLTLLNEEDDTATRSILLRLPCVNAVFTECDYQHVRGK